MTEFKSLSDIAKETKVSKTTIWRYVKSKKIESEYKEGNVFYYDKNKFKHFYEMIHETPYVTNDETLINQEIIDILKKQLEEKD
jgi:AcrR family transcriptional regulator